MEEQFFIMKPNEETTRSFKLYPATDQAAKYVCAVILKDSDYHEADRAECQFTTTATVLDNGSQIAPFHLPKSSINGFFESIESIWNKLWKGLTDFITGKTCRSKCYGFFDFKCHIQYICMGWLVMFGLLLAIFPTVLVLLWLLHQKGLFDPIYDWWEDHFWTDNHSFRTPRMHTIDIDHPHIHVDKHHQHKRRHQKHDAQHKRRSIHNNHIHNHSERGSDYNFYLHQINKEKHKRRRGRNSSVMQRVGDNIGYHNLRKERETNEGLYEMTRHEERQDQLDKHKHRLLRDRT